MKRDVIEEASRDASFGNAAKSDSFPGLASKKKINSLELEVPLCNGCTKAQDDSRLVDTVAQDKAIRPVHLIEKTCFVETLGIDVHVPSKEDRRFMVWFLAC